MAAGRVVFDDVPAALTDDVTRELYGMEANEVIGTETTAIADADVASVPMHA